MWKPNVSFDFLNLLTMIDNKVKNVLLNNRCQQRCPFCGLTMKEAMVHLDLDFLASPEALALMCCSILHFLLRGIELIFKIGYHWTLRKHNPSRWEEWESDIIKARKEAIHKVYWDMGLPIFQMIPGKGPANG